MKVVILCHGNLGLEFKNSLEMIMGKQENFYSFPFLPGESLEDLYEKVAAKFDDDQIIFATDIKGGTPFNVGFKYKFSHENVILFSGVNLPILLEIANQINIMKSNDLGYLKDLQLIEFI